MKRITTSNYESFLLDLSEGNLSPEEMEMVFDFFELHPELASELDELEAGPRLQTSYVTNKKKAGLLKNPSEESLADLIISDCEGIATPQQQAHLNELTQLSPELRLERRMIGSIRLAADNTVHFSRKQLLIQQAPVRSLAWLYRSMAVAAALILAALLIPRGTELPVNLAELAVVTSPDKQEGVRGNESLTINPSDQASVEYPLTDDTGKKETELRTEELLVAQNIEQPLEEIVRLQPGEIQPISQSNPKSKLQLPEEKSVAKAMSPETFSPTMAFSDGKSESQLGTKFSVAIDEKFALSKEDQSLYIKVGRFTVSFVKNIFKRNHDNNEEKK
jgi:hypothetical protein